MSEVEIFAELTNMVDVDPFSLLGISVSADEKRIAKRYRFVAKQLHPDMLAGTNNAKGLTPNAAAQVIARIDLNKLRCLVNMINRDRLSKCCNANNL